MASGAIVVGASSGIGEAVARKLAASGFEVGLAARRTERMREIGEQLPTKSYIATMDLTDTEDAREGFFDLVEAMDSVDLVILSSGVLYENQDLEWELERQTIDVNVRGFVAIATAAIQHFEANAGTGSGRDGHLVGISSIASHLSLDRGLAYTASKAFVTNYLEGLRSRGRTRDADVVITTVEPGYVDTELAWDDLWQISAERAASQIVRAIDRERTHVYVPRRWRLVAWFLELTPNYLIRRLPV